MSEISANPLREGLREEKTAPPCTIVIFGASGDLTRRKLAPALYQLARTHMLGPNTSIVGFARRPWDDDAFRTEMQEALKEFSRVQPLDRGTLELFSQHLHFCSSSFDDPAGYARLSSQLTALEQAQGTGGNRLYYLATNPEYFPVIAEQLGAAGLVSPSGAGEGWTRCIVEKPFGRDLAGAQRLNAQLANVFTEDQVYRIDHYLGKETVQNILVFRLANGIFEPLWNRRYIDHVQISQCETLGMEGRRGAYFDSAGITRDILQNHMLQLLTLMAMEPPVRFAADAVRDEKVKVLQSIRPLTDAQIAERVVRAQYTAGAIGGERVPGYREETGVAADSRTDTYTAMCLEIDNWRWAGVPFYLRTGKRLPKRLTEIAIYFKAAPFAVFDQSPRRTVDSNVLTLRIQPDEGISIRFGSKAPGPDIQIEPVRMDFLYATSFGMEQQEAYERLLLDAMVGDSTLFARRDEVETAWGICTPILDAWEGGDLPGPETYAAGTWGPKAAADLIGRSGRRWKRL